ncbi:hypothetical protein M569_05100, partial [Genlisea aurea]
GLLRIHLIRGTNLARRDLTGSDPYVVVRYGDQKLRSRVVKKDLNPEWNEDLTLTIDQHRRRLPVQLEVYDRDRFSRDDKMGDSEFEIEEFLRALKKIQKRDIPNDGSVIAKLKPSEDNCLAEESNIRCENGTIVQHMFLRLRNVECGEIELRLLWIHA